MVKFFGHPPLRRGDLTFWHRQKAEAGGTRRAATSSAASSGAIPGFRSRCHSLPTDELSQPHTPRQQECGKRAMRSRAVRRPVTPDIGLRSPVTGCQPGNRENFILGIKSIRRYTEVYGFERRHPRRPVPSRLLSSRRDARKSRPSSTVFPGPTNVKAQERRKHPTIRRPPSTPPRRLSPRPHGAGLGHPSLIPKGCILDAPLFCRSALKEFRFMWLYVAGSGFMWPEVASAVGKQKCRIGFQIFGPVPGRGASAALAKVLPQTVAVWRVPKGGKGQNFSLFS